MNSDTKICETCGKEFNRPKRYGIAHFATRRFCSRTCQRRVLIPAEELKAVYRSTKRNGVKIDQHRAIMEEKLGRKLRPGELVHHKDENKKNNDPDNLEVMSHQAHSALHNQKYPLTWTCEHCGVVFTPPPTKRGGRKKTCSKKCRYARLSKMLSK